LHGFYTSKIILHLLHSHGVDILVVQQAQGICVSPADASRASASVKKLSFSFSATERHSTFVFIFNFNNFN